MYEHRGTPPLPLRRFLRRLAGHFAVASALAALSLVAGMAGYHALEGLSWLDSFLNAAMLLGGMGPVGNGPQTPAGKLFAGIYALYSGMVFLVAAGLLLAPVFHRVLHRFHWEADRAEGRRRM
ncbi:MAG TPA: hypothetical protein VEQ10_20855 [Vicinamibacteria bacterium]|nr:hypothetical protein [Vicinamibacteria bacterium]